RHLPSAIGILLVVLLFLLDRLPLPHLGPPQPGLDGVRRRLATTVSGLFRAASVTLAHPIGAFRSTLRDPWLPGYLLCGLLAGLLPLYNGAIFMASAVVLGVMLVVFPNRALMVGLALAAALAAIPQLMFLRPGTMAGEQAYPAFHWGYVVDDPTPLRVATYLGFIFGPKLLLAGIGLAAGTWRQARVFLAFVALVGLAFLVQFSVETLANHKFIHTWLIVANLFVAFGLVWLWESRPSAWLPTRLIALGLAGVIVAGGLIDLVPIKNERMYQAGLDGDPLYEWVRTETKPQDVFLSDLYVVHGILLAGRKVYLGWPYYSWSAGYAVEGRQQWYRDVFALRSAKELVTRLQAAKIAYVAFDDGLRDRGFAARLNEELYRDHFDVVFSDPENRYGHLTIYRVPTDRYAAAALPEAPAADMYVGGRGADAGLFLDPSGIAVEPSGAVLVADRGNNRVQRFSSDGSYLGMIRGPDAGPGQLIGPTGVAVGPDGIVYLAAGDRLLAFDPTGDFVRALSVPGLAAPRWVDIAIDRDGAIFALNAADGLVARFAVDGAITTFGSPGSGDGQLQRASGLAARDGIVAVADPGNGRITVFHGADGTFVRALPVSEWQSVDAQPADVAVGDDGTIWASSPATNAILVYRPDGTLAGSLAPGGAEVLDGPTGLALGSGGRLFVTNAAGNRVTLLTSLHP
ncbi:MAG: NHL repeat-containing protein, partial [Candidatus Limnocylindrales bacterium]